MLCGALTFMQDHLRVWKTALTDASICSEVAMNEAHLLQVVAAALPVAQPLANGSGWLVDLEVRRPLALDDPQEFASVYPGQDIVVEETTQFPLRDPLRRRTCHG
jgi:hypothetical protein